MRHRKYFVTDDDGTDYTIEEEVVDTTTDADETDTLESTSFTDDEVAALKQLAAVAPKLVELISDKVNDADESEDEEDDTSAEIDVDTDEDEVDIDEDDDKMTTDSKSSFGALNRKKKANDSISLEEDINNCWSKRYGGK